MNLYAVKRKYWRWKRNTVRELQESDQWWRRLLLALVSNPGESGRRQAIRLRTVLMLLFVTVYPSYVLGLTVEDHRPEMLAASPFFRYLHHLFHPFPSSLHYMRHLWVYLLMGLLFFWMSIFTLISSKRRMPGKEYGTAKFLRGEDITKIFGDEELSREKILGAETRLSVNDRRTGLNNNVLIIGGSGAGKTFYFVTPNCFQCLGSYIFTDPKGELLRSKGEFFRRRGYRVKVLNLVDMQHSDHYNPFAYIRTNTDVVRLITNLIRNTTPKGAHSSDPFWEKSESLFLQSLFFYVWLASECEGKRNIRSVLELLREAEMPEKAGQKSELDKRMDILASREWISVDEITGKEQTYPGKEHPAYIAYMMVRRGAVDTVRSIIISANARLAFLVNTPQILEILSSDDMELPAIGMGYSGHLQKTALFCVIPDADKTYNSLVGMLYSQLFQELYFQADHHTKTGRLPIDVMFWMDEFANVALPDDFTGLLSTMRGRGISCNIVIQNLAQIKALFDKTWETIPGNCDCLVYLGGNEESTHKYLSGQLGKWTVSKRSYSGGAGTKSSHSDDVLGKELMTPDQIRMLDNRKEIVLIRGQYPVLDQKYDTRHANVFKETQKMGAYIHNPGTQKSKTIEPFGALSESEVEWYKSQGITPAVSLTLEEADILPDDLLDDLSTDDLSRIPDAVLLEAVRREFGFGEDNSDEN